MALLKHMNASNGVPLEYHRITNLMIGTNVGNTIMVNSYIKSEDREREIDNLKAEKYNQEMLEKDPNSELIDTSNYIPVYCEGLFFGTPYDQFMTIDDAYEYLKTLPEFEGAVDC